MSNNFTVFDCNLISFPKIPNRAGNITAVQNGIELPFSVKRVYYLYDIPAGESRGGHAHKHLEQIIIAASGSFDITIDDGKDQRNVQLSRPYFGLYIRPGIWRSIFSFSSGAICLVLASSEYYEGDYFREYSEFKSFKRNL
jgi:hypothetical protein